MCNQKVFGSKLNYEQWRILSGGNIRGYRKYIRKYQISINLFHKKEEIRQAA